MPLVATSLERGLDHAEALVARGYGSGPRTRLPERGPTRGERLALLLALPAAAAVALAVGPGGAATYYPRLDAPAAGGYAAGALAALLAGALALVAIRHRAEAA